MHSHFHRVTVMSLYSIFKTNKDLEVKGIDLQYGEGIIITIARAGGANPVYARVVEAKTKPYRRQIQSETISAELSEQLTREIYAEAIVLDWEGVTDENGEIMPFTKENAVKLFKDLPDLFADIKEQAGKAALFRNDVLAADSKN
mgnify:FL=1